MAPLRLGAVLLCLFYFVSSINDEAAATREAERHSDLPGGRTLAAGHPPPPPWGTCTARARVWSQSSLLSSEAPLLRSVDGKRQIQHPSVMLLYYGDRHLNLGALVAVATPPWG